jgi:hypothetical protein
VNSRSFVDGLPHSFLLALLQTGISMLAMSVIALPDALAGPEDPADGGQWGSVITWPHIAVSAANLPD